MTDPSVRWTALQQRIDQACRAAGRDPDEVTLLAVSKTRDAAAILRHQSICPLLTAAMHNGRLHGS